MNGHLACLACGFQGYDVRMTLIEIPEADRQIVRVPIEHVVRRGQEPEVEYREVREVYAREPRCRDRKACAARLAALELDAVVATEPDPDEAALAQL